MENKLTVILCPYCGGKKRILGKLCGVCRGEAKVEKVTDHIVKVKPGTWIPAPFQGKSGYRAVYFPKEENECSQSG